ncbi:MAG: ribonuclease R [Flavobacteriales bacterium]|nr:ribonuclease R [Flavobacteriales bacterium]MCB9449609.1 ribonuclease R [Flavobacteriales bacterium]
MQEKANQLEDRILEVFRSAPHRHFNYKQMAKQLGLMKAPDRKRLMGLMEKLTAKGLLQEEKRGSFSLKQKQQRLEGVIQIITSGAAFVMISDSSQDIFIKQHHIGSAMNGDTVEVKLLPKKSGKRPEGEVVNVVKRARETFVGTITVEKKSAFLIPDQARGIPDIFIHPDKLNGAKDGQKALVKITEWPDAIHGPEGEVTEVLGYPGDKTVEQHSILAEYGFPLGFEPEVENEANAIPDVITPDEISKRRDFRGVTTFTIDPVDAKDFDDALSIRQLEDGKWEVGIHIADVSHYVRPDSHLDHEAYRRGTSVYLADAVVPMLPERLSNGICSLRPNEEKLCFSAVFTLDETARIHDAWVGRTVILSDHRFTYEAAQEILEGGEGAFASELKQLDTLAKVLRKIRFSNGAIAFQSIETRFRFDDQGKPVEVYIKESKDSNQLIEEFMLLANKHVAEHVGKKLRKPFVYRTHDSPKAEKLQIFSSFISRFGYKIETNSNRALSNSLNKLMQDIKGKGEENIIEQLSIRTMEKAIYTTENIGHYGLAFAYYSHFTSPIRRYPDIMVHRLLADYDAGRKSPDVEGLESKCKHASEMERKATSAERASIKYMQVHFLADKVGQFYEGIVSGVTEWGLFVEIIANKCEGLVRLRTMDDDYYVFDEDNFCVKGSRTGKQYRLGDRVMIVVKKADLIRKQLDFELIPSEY